MQRVFGLTVALLATVLIAVAADESQQTKSDEPDAFDIEPAILKQNLSTSSSPAATPEGDVALREKQLGRAKQNAAGAERLCKVGVLSKMEMEQRLLKVIQCESILANARLSVCKEEIAGLESGVTSGENTKDELAKAKATLAELREAAQIAAGKRQRAELEAAEINLRRQQKLLKLGIARESDVAHAEEKLAELKVPKN